MNDVASQWYEDTNNVNEMLDWNPALSVQEMRLYIHSISCNSVIAPAIFILLHKIRKNINELPEKI